MGHDGGGSHHGVQQARAEGTMSLALLAWNLEPHPTSLTTQARPFGADTL